MKGEALREFQKDKLSVFIAENRQEMGVIAADGIAKKIVSLLKEQETVNIVFAAAPSQNDVLESLSYHSELDWRRIVALHMDEYEGMTREHPQSFGFYLDEHIFGTHPFKEVFYIGCGKGVKATCKRYGAILENHKPDIVLMGIGENGHIAFNDPGVADFSDKETIKPVPLDEICRMQQVHDGCFESLEIVPKRAYTLTVPALFSAKSLFCSVPCKTKASAVKRMLCGEIGESCPATILRRHGEAKLYLDADSASLLDL